jgi:hypothetical protein
VFVRSSAVSGVTLFPLGSTTVTMTATDVFNNVATCSFTVVVRDQEAPKIVCPASQVVTTPANTLTAVANWTIPRTSDNVAGPIVLQTPRLPFDRTFALGLTSVRYTATDAAGNINTCAFTVMVVDMAAPALLLCPDNIVVGNDAGLPTGRFVPRMSSLSCPFPHLSLLAFN